MKKGRPLWELVDRSSICRVRNASCWSEEVKKEGKEKEERRVSLGAGRGAKRR